MACLRHRDRHALVLSGLLVAMSACGGRQTPRLAPGEARVADVRIEGNHGIASGVLLKGLALTRLRDSGQAFDPFLVSQDLERVRGVYLRRGFFAVLVSSRVAQRDSRVWVYFTVQEGPRSRLTRVDMVGLPDDPHISRQRLRELIPLADGDPFRYEIYDEARPFLLHELERAGYAYARLDGKVAADRVRHEAIIRLEFAPGAVCSFGKVELRGVSGELAESVRARILAREGERYSADLLADTQAEIYEMRRFGNVRVEPDRSSGNTAVPIIITVAESPPHELRLGGGVGVNPTAFEIRGRAVYQIAGWPRPLTTSHFELRPAYVFLRDGSDNEPRIEAIASLERLDFIRPRMRGELELSWAYLAVEAYTSVGPRVRLGLRTPLYRRIIDGAIGWQLRVLDFSRIDPAVDEATRVRLGLEAPYLLGFYEQSLSVDLRDSPVEPHRGLYGELRVEEGSIAAGGEFEYLRATPELRGYAPLGPLVLAARGRVGGVFGDLPVTQRYFAGGASSQRGFPERRLAPTVLGVVDGNVRSIVVGGGGLLETSLELRLPLGRPWNLELGGVAFLDGADVTERLDGIDVTRLHWATGLGLRVATPVGPVRLDVGYRLNRVGAGEIRPDDRFAYHLSLGEAF